MAAIVAFELTGSALVVGAVTAVQFAPQLLFAPLSGKMADCGNAALQIVAGRMLTGLGSGGLALWILLSGGVDGLPGAAPVVAVRHRLCRQRHVRSRRAGAAAGPRAGTRQRHRLLGPRRTAAVALVAFGLSGVGMTLAFTSITTQIQNRSPDALRGRIMALWFVGFLGARPFAAGLNGFVADAVNVSVALAVTALLVTLAAYLCRPSRLDAA